jgi:hypothetical protein
MHWHTFTSIDLSLNHSQIIKPLMEQYFTTPETAVYLVNLGVLFSANERIYLEPCAGDGAIASLLPSSSMKIDIDASLCSQHQWQCHDYLMTSPSSLEISDRVFVIGNPPFSLAKRFLLHSLKVYHSSTLFILPKRCNNEDWIQSIVNEVGESINHYIIELPEQFQYYRKRNLSGNDSLIHQPTTIQLWYFNDS